MVWFILSLYPKLCDAYGLAPVYTRSFINLPEPSFDLLGARYIEIVFCNLSPINPPLGKNYALNCDILLKSILLFWSVLKSSTKSLCRWIWSILACLNLALIDPSKPKRLSLSIWISSLLLIDLSLSSQISSGCIVLVLPIFAISLSIANFDFFYARWWYGIVPFIPIEVLSVIDFSFILLTLL